MAADAGPGARPYPAARRGARRCYGAATGVFSRRARGGAARRDRVSLQRRQPPPRPPHPRRCPHALSRRVGGTVHRGAAHRAGDGAAPARQRQPRRDHAHRLCAPAPGAALGARPPPGGAAQGRGCAAAAHPRRQGPRCPSARPRSRPSAASSSPCRAAAPAGGAASRRCRAQGRWGVGEGISSACLPLKDQPEGKIARFREKYGPCQRVTRHRLSHACQGRQSEPHPEPKSDRLLGKAVVTARIPTARREAGGRILERRTASPK